MGQKTPDYILKTIAISLGFAFAFVLLEIVARILPSSKHFDLKDRVECEWVNLKSKTNDSCIFMQKLGQSGRYTVGKLPPFPVNAMKSVNDIGQFSDVNFNVLKSQDSSNIYRILSIGDSYVEALQVPNKNSFHGILNSYNSSDGKTVISTAIGKSGDPLSQYLLNIQFAHQKINLKNVTLILSIIPNDFDESIYGYKGSSPGAYFELDDQGQKYKFKHIPYIRSFRSKVVNSFLRASSLGSYLVHNIKILSLIARLSCLFPDSPCNTSHNFAANVVDVSASGDPKRFRDASRATDIFLENLVELRPSEEERKRTIFVIDADRQPIYDSNIMPSKYFQAQRQYFIKRAKDLGFSIIDMQLHFADHYIRKKEKFEFSNDGHWNSLGHKIVSQKIAKELNLTPQVP